MPQTGTIEDVAMATLDDLKEAGLIEPGTRMHREGTIFENFGLIIRVHIPLTDGSVMVLEVTRAAEGHA